MARIITIADLLVNIDTATKVARVLYEKNLTMDATELKTRFSELLGVLTDAKLQLSEMQELIDGKNRQIRDLEEASKFRDKLICVRDAYYMTDAKGKPIGDAHCVKCWENTTKKRKLIVKTDDAQVKICPTCNQTYSRAETENIQKKFRLFKF